MASPELDGGRRKSANIPNGGLANCEFFLVSVSSGVFIGLDVAVTNIIVEVSCAYIDDPSLLFE